MRATFLLLFLAVPASAAPCDVPGAGAPQREPAVFGDRVLSTGDQETHVQITPDGKTIYYLKGNPAYTGWTIVQSTFKNGKWSPPEVAPFSGAYDDADPFITADGKQLFFISNRPLSGKGEPRPDLDIWVMDRTDRGWGEPRHLDAPVSSDANEWFPTVARDGTLYFGSEREGGKGRSDIYAARWRGGKYEAPENLADINGPTDEYEPLIAYDGSFLLFIAGRPGGKGSLDIYVTYPRDGKWTPPQLLPEPINSPTREIGIKFSPDGTRFFLSSNRLRPSPRGKRRNIAQLERELRASGNGLGDLYVMDAAALGIEGYSPEKTRMDMCR